MQLTIPDFALIVIDGATREAADELAARFFDESEMLAPSTPSGLIARVTARLADRRFAAVNIAGLSTEERQGVLQAARETYCKAVAIVVDAPDRPVSDDGLKRLANDGCREINHLSVEQAAELTIDRKPLRCDRRGEHGPFDIIGDVHGCCDEVEMLLVKLGYLRRAEQDHLLNRKRGEGVFVHPLGRRALFLGDLCDRGPRIVDSYRTVMAMVEHGSAICLLGNHDEKLKQLLNGKRTRVTRGVEMTMAELDALGDGPQGTAATKQRIAEFIETLSSHYTLNGGELVVAHGGLIEAMHNRHTADTRAFGIYGDTTGEIDRDGFPVRRDWAIHYSGHAIVVYGHTVVAHPTWVNRTIDIDTGCVFGGWLTALRYPELQLVRQRAVKQHYHSRYGAEFFRD